MREATSFGTTIVGLGLWATLAGCLLVDPFPELAADAADTTAIRPGAADPCGGRCVPGPHTTGATCVNGRCVLACVPGFADCNGRADDGCETDPNTDPRSCGGCGKPCVEPHGSAVCSDGRCTIACTAPYQDCDGRSDTGCESDGVTDAANCGACGHACDGACYGHCLSVEMTTGQGEINELALGPEAVYFAGESSVIGFCPLRERRAYGIAFLAGSPSALALSPTTIYWFVKSFRTIRSALLTPGGGAGTDVALVEDQYEVVSMAAIDDALYWSESTTNEIRALAGSTYRTVVSSPTDGVGRVVVDATNLYYVGPLTNRVFVLSRNGGTPQRLFEHKLPVTDIIVDHSTVYIAVGNATGRELWSVDAKGTGPPPPARHLYSPERAAPKIATDGAFLYYAVPDTGEIWRIHTAGGPNAFLFAAGQSDPSAIAIDATHVYWINRGTGSVMKMENFPL